MSDQEKIELTEEEKEELKKSIFFKHPGFALDGVTCPCGMDIPLNYVAGYIPYNWISDETNTVQVDILPDDQELELESLCACGDCCKVFIKSTPDDFLIRVIKDENQTVFRHRPVNKGTV